MRRVQRGGSGAAGEGTKGRERLATDSRTGEANGVRAVGREDGGRTKASDGGDSGRPSERGQASAEGLGRRFLERAKARYRGLALAEGGGPGSRGTQAEGKGRMVVGGEARRSESTRASPVCVTLVRQAWRISFSSGSPAPFMRDASKGAHVSRTYLQFGAVERGGSHMRLFVKGRYWCD